METKYTNAFGFLSHIFPVNAQWDVPRVTVFEGQEIVDIVFPNVTIRVAFCECFR